jgi:hypothetical protein
VPGVTHNRESATRWTSSSTRQSNSLRDTDDLQRPVAGPAQAGAQAGLDRARPGTGPGRNTTKQPLPTSTVNSLGIRGGGPRTLAGIHAGV